MKFYYIKYKKDSKELIATCSEYSLNMIRKYIENMGGNIISIKIRTPLSAEKKENSVKIEKSKYYVSRYNLFYKKHENRKISTEMFNEIKNKLRELKKETNNKAEFQEKFEEYLKAKNILEIKVKETK